jgi:Dolichyl-phosphate-mannose-protein mannosyltransferase
MLNLTSKTVRSTQRLSVLLTQRPDLILAFVLFVIALAARVPNYMTVPPLTDEFKEVGWAIQMVEKNRWPLVAYDSYDGPLFAYLIALALRVFGYSIYLPRLFVLIVGALTVVATYFLGKEFARGDRRVGVIAALLLAANFHHILFNSHIAWSNDTTPLFTTLAVLAYVHATRARRPAWLAGAAALYALAVHTHPSALLLLPAFLFDFGLERARRAWLRTPWPYLAGFTAFAIYSPVIYYNLTTNWDSIRLASQQTGFEASPILLQSVGNIVPTLRALANVALGSNGRMLGNTIWSDPNLYIFVIMSGTALVWMARSGEKFPLVAFLTATLGFASFNYFMTMPDSSRYYQFMNPLIFTAWGALGIHLWDRLGERAVPSRRRRYGRALLALAFVALLLSSLVTLEEYYQTSYASGKTNAAMIAMVEATRANPCDPVLIDYHLGDLRTGRGGVVAGDLDYLFNLERRKHDWATTRDLNSLKSLRAWLNRQDQAYLILFGNARSRLGSQFPLQPLIQTRFPCPSCTVPNEFTLFRWQNPRAPVRESGRLRSK